MSKILLFVVLAMTILTACGGTESTISAEEAYTVVNGPVIVAGDTVPAPKGEVILTITGKIGSLNEDNSLQFDMETLEQLGVVEYRVDDKQAEGQEALFQGVLMSKLLDVAGVDADATVLYTTALNDYAIEIPLTDIEEYPVLLATAVEGQRMPIERYGPTRIIYPYHAYDLDETIYDPRWIWQVAVVEVR